VLPGAFTLWRGRSLARLADDPALSERLLANRSPNGAVFGFCVAILIAIAGNYLAWALPLLIVTRMVAGYPLRKVLHRETWSLGAYLSFFLRLVVAAVGFWILLAMTPWFVALSGTHEWIVAGGLALALFAWGERSSTVFHAVLRARPVDDPVLLARFARMLKACGLPAVMLEQIDLRGGVFANAVAVPSTRRPMVVVSSTLVERLDHEEVAAILAHELAHLEHFNPRRLRRMRVARYALLAAGVLLTPVIRLMVPQTPTAILVLWPVALVAAMVLQAQHRQKHETASDLRALSLGCDAEALIRALTKLHAFARLPRRWDTEFERHATHPSLARRIQAIRAAAGTPPASLGDAAAFAGLDGGSSVTFHDDRLLWNEGPSASHSLDYAHVTMLRVDARRSGATRLVAVDRANRRWEMVLRPSDVARAQATLDIVDTRLAAAAGPPVVSLALSRALAIIAVIAALTITQVPVALLAWIAIVLPAPSVTAAAGAASVGAAALIWRDHAVWMKDTQPWVALALMICGLSLIGVSIANRREKTPAFVPTLASLLALGTVVAWGAIVFSGIDAIDLHYAALEWPSAAVLSLALAGAFALARWRSLPYASVSLAMAGFIAVALGSTTFLHRFANDPFLPPNGSVKVTTVPAEAWAEFQVPFAVTALRLSPAGHFVALGSENEDEETTIHAGPAGGPLTDFTADEAVFVDEGRLLLLERQRGASVLRVVDLQRENRDGWSVRVPLTAARLLFDTTSSEWRLLGWNAGDIVSAAGTVGDRSIHEDRWKTPVDDIDNLEALSISGREVLARETLGRSRFPGGGPFWRWADIDRPGLREESRFWMVSPQGSAAILTSRLDLRCRGASTGVEGTTCTAFDGTRTGFFAVDPATRRSTVLASVPGHFYLRTDAGRGWVLGSWNLELVLVRATTQQAIRVAEAHGGPVNQLAIADKTLGAVSWNGHGSTVRLHSIE
jgi:Zn-dependent protease with chaperone function